MSAAWFRLIEVVPTFKILSVLLPVRLAMALSATVKLKAPVLLEVALSARSASPKTALRLLKLTTGAAFPIENSLPINTIS